MNALQLLNFGSQELKKRNIPSHKLDSELLLSKVLKKRRAKIITNLNQKINLIHISQFNDYIKRRSSKEPIAYILKEKEFWSKSFDIEKNTLIPRPETELMVEKLLKIFKNKSPNVIDIGTGSGCILISLLSEIKNSKGLGIDISQQSILLAKKNAKKLKVIKKIKFSRKPLKMLFNYKFDLVMSNPPYIKTKDIKNLQDDIKYFEPKLALDGGIDGLDVIKKVIYKTKEILKKNGVLALEIGNNQYKEVSKILVNNNFRIEHKIKDYKENVRCLISKYTN